jgi:uncharacterized repeat protein (TIGR01451 family)
LTNTVTVTPPTGVTDPNPNNNQATAITTVNRQADLFVTKTADQFSYNVGNTVTYYLTITNFGPSTATNVVVTDTIPAGLSFVSATNGGTESGGVITWIIPILAVNGQFTPSFMATVNAGTQGQNISNTASAYNNENPNPVTSNPANIYINNAPLSITKTTDKAQPNVGETITYTINVTNTSEQESATGVVITDTLPEGLTFVSASDDGVWDANTRTITWNVGNLAPEASFTPTVTATVTSEAAAKTLVNTATARNDQIDNPVSAQTSIYVPSADLVLTKTVDNTKPTVRDTIHFTMIVNNLGPDTAVNVQVADKMPAGLRFVSYTANYGTYDPATGIWNIGNLPKGASAVITITSIVENSGNIINEAKVTSDTYDPNLDGNTATAAINAQQPAGPAVNAATEERTIGMQKTGTPIAGLILALLAIFSGFLIPKRK